jgi:hypothetical protein
MTTPKEMKLVISYDDGTQKEVNLLLTLCGAEITPIRLDLSRAGTLIRVIGAGEWVLPIISI